LALSTPVEAQDFDGYVRMNGTCRGVGGDNDKVNMKFKNGMTAEACAEECNSHAHCAGFGYSPDANDGECLIYGPDFAGACSDTSASSPTACAALGSCSNADQTSEESCGACSESSGTTKASCEGVGGVWTAATWTSAGATWNEPSDGYMSDYRCSTHVVGVVASAGYTCYDADPEDHHPTCSGSDATCAAAFDGLEMDAKVSDTCPSGCTFTAAVRACKVVVDHAPAIQFDGWRVMAGVCRSAGDPGSLEAKPNGRYTNSAGANGVATQEECKDFCAAEPDCVGYAHSTAWCLIYGPGLDVLDEGEESELWYSDSHSATTITQTKPNPAYICGVKVDDPTEGPTAPADSTTEGPTADPADDEEDEDEDDVDSGAMIAASFLLTSLLQ